MAFLAYACHWLFVLRDVVFFHETGDAACFVEVLEGNHGLQERCLPFAEQKLLKGLHVRISFSVVSCWCTDKVASCLSGFFGCAHGVRQVS